jgi:hypothetical protein
MSLKRRLHNEDIAQELILGSDTDARISDDDILFPQSDGGT